ncbi:hypothetical protein [Actibacterium ureilyticum]|uniref:hypothetical protein n=1 Tax=Actibacterium ureilyticum TaxID=1590614 RepID=UPI001140A6A1|nr:hypothetical protein [Actibacterium ureilyticum]
MNKQEHAKKGRSLFGLFKKEPQSKLRVMGHDLEVVSITRGGKILFTGETARKFPKDHFEGTIMEVAFVCKSGSPYFAYYTCPDYYFAVAAPGGSASFGGPFETEKFRSTASQAIGAFVVKLLKDTLKLDAGREIISFSHNRAHTNTLAYVSSIGEWAPIQENDDEGEGASERKVVAVNAGHVDISDVIAVDELSPSAR